MSTLVYVASGVPWHSTPAERRFQKQLLGHLIGVITLSAIIASIPLPETTPTKPGDKPATYAEIILPKPVPIVEPKVVTPEQQPLPKPPEPRQEIAEAIVAPVKQTVKQAREKARQAGILAFQDDLAEMRQALDPSKLQDTASLSQGRGSEAKLARNLITAKDSARQASVDISQLSNETGGIALAGRESTIVEAEEDITEVTGAVRLVRPENTNVRSIEEVRRVFDANKGAIFAIYNRALRKNPGLLGKVVLELVIQPDGSVSNCLVLASEVSDSELIARVLQRVQLFNFGAKNVQETRISYPVHFLPG